MARQIIWTQRAQNERKEIFKYWNNNNGSNFYSKKLNELIKQSLSIICKYPYIGRATEINHVRIKVLKEYLIIYEITDNEIIVLSLWDGRRNPEDLDLF